MLSVNRATILGNLTRDPELRTTPTGKSVCSISVATNRRWSNPDGSTQDAPEYHEIVVWGKTAESVCPMLQKGKPVYIEGRLQTRSWDGQDGVKRYKTEIVADFISAISARGGSEASFPEPESAGMPAPKKTTKIDKPADEETIDLDSIPF